MAQLGQCIVVGGGLAGLSAAHTVLERGGRVLLLDKKPFMGGNSVKATSGINGALTKTQIRKGITDSPDIFLQDTANSGAGVKSGATPTPLNEVLAYGSAPAVDWLIESFNLDLSLVSRLGGHSQPRTHRGKERFPGMTITYALMERFEEIASNGSGRARMIMKAEAKELLRDASGSVYGVRYVKDGQTHEETGCVIIATGGYGADFAPNSLLQQHRPDLAHLPTTNGDHCSGDGIKMATAIGAGTVDLNAVQVHPTGLVHPEEPDAKLKFLAAEALRGCGGILIDRDGNRFCDELGRRDYVTGEMWKQNKAPYRLVLNSAASREIEWHCKHYCGRGLMKFFKSGDALAKEMGVPKSKLQETFAAYNQVAKSGNDPYNKKFFHNVPIEVNDSFNVAIVTPVIHYCMGGLHVNTEAQLLEANSQQPIPGLFATGEVLGGVHGKNRLGGSSLLDCVVFGRVSGASAARFLLDRHLAGAGGSGAAGRLERLAGHVVRISVGDTQIDISQGATSAPQIASPDSVPADAPIASQAPAPSNGPKEFTLDDVAKHNTEKDCWVVVNGEVLDATGFLNDHPGGKAAIMLFAGRDASAEFNMLHKPDVVEKFAPETIIGKLKQ